MSNLSRIELLQSFADQEPDNPFNWYALALEFQKDNPEKTVLLFHDLLKKHPEYLPTYYQAAGFFADRGDINLSRSIYESGIALAKKQNQNNTLRELQNAYQNFLFENDLM